MKALDLFCGAGGATKGLQRAGFHVTGVDIKPQPNYCGDVFHQADALAFPLDEYDFIWAGPTCKRFSRMTNCRPGLADTHPDQIQQLRTGLIKSSRPYVIENVEGAPLIRPLLLCGTMFGLAANGKELRRHRLFEIGGFCSPLVPQCDHRLPALAVYGHSGGIPKKGQSPRSLLWERREGMQIPWMNRDEIAEAIPPTYSEFIGRRALEAIETAAQSY